MNGDLYPIRYLKELMDEQGVTVSYRLVYMGDNLSPAIIEATTSHHTFVARGIEWTIADAKVKAAVSFLEHLGYTCEQTISEKSKTFRKNVETQLKSNPISTLQNLCMQRGWRFPLYQYQGFGPNQSHIIKCTVEYYWAKATCRTKHEAKKRVAEMVFRMIVDLREPMERPVENERSSSLPSGSSSFDVRPSFSSRATQQGSVCPDVGQGAQSSSISSECSTGFCHDPLDSSSPSTAVPIKDLTKVSDLVISEVSSIADDKRSESLTIVSPLDSEGSLALLKDQGTDYPDALPKDRSPMAAIVDCVMIVNGPRSASGSSTNVLAQTSPDNETAPVNATLSPVSTDTILEPIGKLVSLDLYTIAQSPVDPDHEFGEAREPDVHSPVVSSTSSENQLQGPPTAFVEDSEGPEPVENRNSVSYGEENKGAEPSKKSSTNVSAQTSPENEITSADAKSSPIFTDTILEPSGKSGSLDLPTIAQIPVNPDNEFGEARNPDVQSPVVGSTSSENHLQEPPTRFVEDSEGQEPVEYHTRIGNGEENEGPEPSIKTRFSMFKRAKKCLKNVGRRLLCCCRASTED